MSARDAGLDALRALGALLVLFAHGGYFLFSAWPMFDAYALAGWIGTDIFFALSGFLVTRQLISAPLRDTGVALRFVAWRAWRILPFFWLFLVLHVVLAQADGRALPPSLAAYVGLVQNVASPHPAFFGEAWNLPLLFAFTLAAPGVVLGAAWLGDRVRIVTGAFVLLLLLGIALRGVWVMEQDPLWDEGVRKLVVTRIDACLYGALAALLLQARVASVRLRTMAMVLATIMLLIAGAAFLLLPRDVSALARVGLFVASGVGTAALCVAALGSALPARRVWSALARWSWPLYLVNMPLLFAMSLAGFGQSQAPGAGAMRFIVWLVLSIALAALLHYALERPWLRLRARVFSAAAAIAATSR